MALPPPVYVTPPGALGYLREDGFSDRTAVRLLVHDFQPARYVQRNAQEFVSHLSILDVAAHLGWDATRGYVCPLSDTVRTLQGAP